MLPVEIGNLARRTVVVTFDDGYGDNLSNAKPLLELHEIPATVFVTSGYVEQEREFWWDELEAILLQPGVLPETLRLVVNGHSFEWSLAQDAYYSEEEYQRNLCWTLLDKDNPTARHGLYCSLCEVLRPLVEEERRRVLRELRTWAGAQTKGQATRRALAPDEVLRLADGELIEVGAHTVNHPVLSELSPEAQRAEIVGSKTSLEDILGQPVNSFSYPFGSRSDYTAETVRIVRKAGFTCACSNFPGTVRRRTDRFQLPRFLVRDWDGDEFARRLEEWFRA